MRAFALLLVVVVAVLLVMKFYPSSTEVEAGGGASNPGTVPEAAKPAVTGDQGAFRDQFLADPTAEQPAPATSAPGRASATVTRPPAPAAVAPATPPPAARRAPSTHGTEEAALGAAVLHGAAGELSRLLDERRVAGERRACLQAFAAAVAGDRERAATLAAQIGNGGEVPAAERRALDLALGESGAVPRAASARSEGPVPLAMGMALLAREGGEFLAAGAFAAAARDYSELLLLELDAPWAADRATLAGWSRNLAEAQRHHRWSPRGEWPSVTIQVEEGDHLTAVRKRYLAQFPDRVLCTGLVARANRITGFIHPGDELRIPTDLVSVVVDLAARWVLYMHADEVVAAWEVGVGRPGEETVTGDFVVGIKKENPSWMRVGQEAIPFGDPRNPLGTRWIGWNQEGRATSYGFHGTKDPQSIGTAASDGCIRFHNESVEELFEILPVGAPIHVRD